jgi:hypothetical protein
MSYNVPTTLAAARSRVRATREALDTQLAKCNYDNLQGAALRAAEREYDRLEAEHFLALDCEEAHLVARDCGGSYVDHLPAHILLDFNVQPNT